MLATGSIWRKWDLQVQTRLDAGYACLGPSTLTPEQLVLLSEKTKLTTAEIKSQEKEIDPIKYAKLFVGYITNFTDIEGIAVTDHNRGDELDHLIDAANETNGKLTILPGVEVCSNHGIHMLCIFDPANNPHATWKDFIDHFLTEIGVSQPRFETGNRPKSSNKSSQDIMNIVELKKGICIFAHIGTENGLFYRNSPTANGGTAHIDIYKHPLCQIVQVPTTSQLSQSTDRIISGGDTNYGPKIATRIKCSDSRKLSEIGKPFTWIKGDANFEGLKQIIFEPTERARIQDNKPETKSTYQVIESVRIIDPQHRFGSEVISLNRNLVAITGGKSTGKSLLLYHLAKAADKEEVDLRRKDRSKDQGEPYQKFNDLEVEVKWADGKTTTISGQNETTQNSDRKVTYIPQGYLNHISDTEFSIVDDVVKKLLLQKEKAKAYLSQFQSQNQQAKTLLATKISELFVCKSDIEKLREEIKLIGTEDGIKSYIEKVSNEISSMSEKYGFSTEEVAQKADLEQNFLDHQERSRTYEEDISVIESLIHNAAGITSAIDFDEMVWGMSESNRLTIQNIFEQVKKEATEKLTNELTAQLDKIKEQKQEICRDRFLIGRPLVKLKKKAGKLSELEERNKTLNAEKEKLKKVIRLNNSIRTKSADYKILKSEIIDAYKLLCAAHAALKNSLAQFDHDLSDIDLSVGLYFDEIKFEKDFHSAFIDGRKSKFDDINMSYDQADPEKHFSKMEANFDALLNQSMILKGSADIQKAISSLFENRLRLRFGITYRNDDFNLMSPGKKGLVLLKMLVELDNNSHPILLDQPEDDLDNRSIYKDLATFLRDKKKHRQIIIVTHNPNLVIGTDAEQVIVGNQAGQDERRENKQHQFEFVAGAIENSFKKESAHGILHQKGIREHICEILEGGEDAFKKREERYNIRQLT